MSIAVIIVTYKNSKKELHDVKKSLLANDIPNKDIFFSDNAKENIGYGRGISRIVKKQLANYDYFLVLNPDTIVHKGCIAILAQELKRNNKSGIVGPKILDGQGRIWSVGGEIDPKRYSGGLIDFGKKNKIYKEKVISVDYVSGTAMLIRREVFENIGPFAEDYFLYYEDVDFCQRARKAGWGVVVIPEAVITHIGSTTTGHGSPLMHYYLARNRLLFMEKFAPFKIKIRELFRLPKTIKESNKYELYGIRDFLLKKVGKVDYFFT